MSKRSPRQASLPFYNVHHEGKRAKPYRQMERLLECVDFESFRPLLEKIFPAPKRGGRLYDLVLIFKVMVLQKFYGMSDETAEDQILVNTAFQYFLGIGPFDRVPDARTITLYWNKLKPEDAKALFDKFYEMMLAGGLKVSGGCIADATFVDTPRQYLSKEEREYIEKTGEMPEEWSEGKKRQMDMDRKFVRKGGEKHCGYKNTPLMDEKTKTMRDYTVKPANVHDVKALNRIVPKDVRSVKLDSGYTGVELEREGGDEDEPGRRRLPLKVYIVKRRVRGQKELSAETKLRNRRISRSRSRGEHPFAMLKQMGGDYTRSVGLERNTVRIGMVNLVYNMRRFCHLASTGQLCPGVAA